jgi:hypothetical protein
MGYIVGAQNSQTIANLYMVVFGLLFGKVLAGKSYESCAP